MASQTLEAEPSPGVQLHPSLASTDVWLASALRQALGTSWPACVLFHEAPPASLRVTWYLVSLEGTFTADSPFGRRVYITFISVRGQDTGEAPLPLSSGMKAEGEREKRRRGEGRKEGTLLLEGPSNLCLDGKGPLKALSRSSFMWKDHSCSKMQERGKGSFQHACLVHLPCRGVYLPNFQEPQKKKRPQCRVQQC